MVKVCFKSVKKSKSKHRRRLEQNAEKSEDEGDSENEMEGTFDDDDLDALVNKVIAKNSAANVEAQQQFIKDAAAQAASTAVAGCQQLIETMVKASEDRSNAKIEALSVKVEALSTVAGSSRPPSEAGSRAGSSGLNGQPQFPGMPVGLPAYITSATAYRNRDSVFKPPKFVIKGWIKNWKDAMLRQNESLTEEELLEWMEKLLKELDAISTRTIDMDAVRDTAQWRFYHTRIDVHIHPEAELRAINHCRYQINQVLKRLGTTLLAIKGVKPYCVADCEEHLKPARSAGGRFHGAMEEAGITKDKYRIEWGLDLSVLCLVDREPGTKPPSCAQWSEAGGWVLKPEVMTKLLAGQVDHSAILAKLNSF